MAVGGCKNIVASLFEYLIYSMETKAARKYFPSYGYLGIILILVFWYLNWNLEGLRTNILFFPLWLGYILVVDAIVFSRKSTSLLTRCKIKFIYLFLISTPAWWLFELINRRTQNWFYDGIHFFTDFEYAFLASISFSTVMPAVFCTAELAATFKWLRKFRDLKALITDNSILKVFFSAGLVMIILIIILPSHFYYLEWAAVYFLLEPINYKLKNDTLFNYLRLGDWRPVIALSTSALLCGFFWEMWNYYSYPKWIYNTPMVNFLHIFEMPLLGYIGYIPFAWELFAIYNFIIGLIKKTNSSSFKLQLNL
jgi:hypothetical protein